MVAPEMARLVASLSSGDYLNAHPVVQAAYLHYSLAAIHPFADGNGRVSRALASVPLYRALRVPLLVFRDQRDAYLDALGQADAGMLQALVHFISERTVDTADLAIVTTKVGPAAARERSLDALRRMLMPFGEISDATLNASAVRVLEATRHELHRQLADLALPDSVLIETYLNPGWAQAPADYRLAEPALILTMRIRSAPPAAIETFTFMTAFVATSPGLAPVRLGTDVETEPLDLAVRDITPELREVTRIKIASWIGIVLDEALRLAAEAIDNAQVQQQRARQYLKLGREAPPSGYVQGPPR
jgi:hypothetical protein